MLYKKLCLDKMVPIEIEDLPKALESLDDEPMFVVVKLHTRIRNGWARFSIFYPSEAELRRIILNYAEVLWLGYWDGNYLLKVKKKAQISTN